MYLFMVILFMVAIPLHFGILNFSASPIDDLFLVQIKTKISNSEHYRIVLGFYHINYFVCLFKGWIAPLPHESNSYLQSSPGYLWDTSPLNGLNPLSPNCAPPPY